MEDLDFPLSLEKTVVNSLLLLGYLQADFPKDMKLSPECDMFKK